jgi:serine/threonine protein kinase
MTTMNACVSPVLLREHLEGNLLPGDEAAVIVHLDTCGDCQQTLEHLAVGDESFMETARVVAGDGSRGEAALDSVLRALLGRIETLPPDSTTTAPEGPASEALEFLDPPREAGHLGRLAHYEVTEIVARGGMGTVLKAIDEKLGRVVCLKVLAPQIAASERARERFIREARAAAKVRSEQVVTLYAVEEYRGHPYLVMEYIAGRSLQDELDCRGSLSVEEVVRIGIEIAEGLAAAHAEGLVHRDIKPGNVLLEGDKGQGAGDRGQGTGNTEQGTEERGAGPELSPVSCHLLPSRAKLTDFGLARAVDDARLTREGVVAGTPEFMAPEQARGEAVDHRADLFSLGSVMYAMCSGHSPFQALGSLAVLRRICEDKPFPVQALNPSIPDGLVRIIDRLLAKDPAQRPPSAAKVAELLRQIDLTQRRNSLVAVWRRNAKAGRWLAAAALVLVSLSLVALYAGPPAVMWLRSEGELEVAAADPHLQVIVLKDGKEVARLFPSHEARIRLKAGSYELRLEQARADLHLDRSEITLPRAGTVQVAVETKPGFVGELRRMQGTHQVLHVASSADGKVVLAGTGQRLKDGVLVWEPECPIYLWDVETAKELKRIDGHRNSIRSVALSADANRAFAASNDQSVRIWDLTTGKALWGFDVGPHALNGIHLSRDGQRLLGGGFDKMARLWDVTTSRELWRSEEQEESIATTALAPDGRFGLTGGSGRYERTTTAWLPGSDHTILLWDFEAKQPIRRFPGHTRHVSALSISPDGRRALSGSHDNSVRLWDIASGEEIHCMVGHASAVQSVTFSPDGRWALSASEDASVRLWDLENGKQRYQFLGHQGPVRCVIFCSDGRRAISGGNDGTVRLWQLPE